MGVLASGVSFRKVSMAPLAPSLSMVSGAFGKTVGDVDIVVPGASVRSVLVDPVRVHHARIQAE